MKGWLVSDTGDKWSVKLDVGDFGGHLDSTYRARATTLGHGIAAVVPKVPSVSVVPLDFCGKLRFLRTMHIPAALHVAEASLVSQAGLRRLWSATGRAAMSDVLRLANPGAVLNLLDGLAGSDPGYHDVWCRFWMLRGHMACNSSVHELARVYSLLRVVAAGATGHGPVHLLLSSAASLGFSWDLDWCV